MDSLKTKKQTVRLVLSVAFLASVFIAANNAFAEPGFYVGGAAGMSRVNNSDFDDNDTAFKILAGGKFGDYVGIEAAVNDYGEAEGRGYSSELTGNTLALVGFFPLMDNFDLFAKGGQLWWRDKVTVLDIFRDTLTGNETFYGVGADFYFNKNIALRIEMERYKVELSRSEIGVNVDGDSDVDVASVGVSFHF